MAFFLTLIRPRQLAAEFSETLRLGEYPHVIDLNIHASATAKPVPKSPNQQVKKSPDKTKPVLWGTGVRSTFNFKYNSNLNLHDN
jgi:hypothetical protein